MKNNKNNKSFWATLPGILIGISVIISTIVFYYIVLHSVTTAPTQHPTPTSIPKSIPGTVAVEIKDFAFNPATITISKGTTIIWTQKDSSSHTVTIASGAGFDSGTLNQSQTFSYTFNEIGTFNYGCSIHPSMNGKVIVIQ